MNPEPRKERDSIGFGFKPNPILLIEHRAANCLGSLTHWSTGIDYDVVSTSIVDSFPVFLYNPKNNLNSQSLNMKGLEKENKY